MLLDEVKGTHGLEQLAVKYLNVKPYEDKIKPYLKSGNGYGDAPDNILREYLAKDCCYIHMV